jgi:hypothetical protein
MSTPVTTEATGTRPTQITTFYTADTFEPLTFEWTRQMPANGYLGNVTFRQFKKKNIQVFDPKPVSTYGVVLGTSWAFQAQDGSFICRMFVSAFNDLYITFSDRKSGNWPLVSVFSFHHSAVAASSAEAIK